MGVYRFTRSSLVFLSLTFVLFSCVGDPEPPPQPTLNAPGGSNPAAVTALNEGNQRFAEGRWGAAKVQFERAMMAQPDLAEAHYNLALALERLGDHEQARQHYIEAANLAPGHKVIWDSPPLRRHGNVQPKEEDSGPPPKLPPLSGLGGGPGGGF